jgi:hypothetical protein
VEAIDMITSIPTVYAGQRFRSRLEADWACTLHAWRMDALYETDGFVLPSGQCYLPDFYLSGCHTWLEVKGAAQGLEKFYEFARELSGPVSELGYLNRAAVPMFVLALPSTNRPRFDVACPWCLAWIPYDESERNPKGMAHVGLCRECNTTQFRTWCYDCGMDSRCFLGACNNVKILSISDHLEFRRVPRWMPSA